AEHLSGASVLYNNYWVRFNYRNTGGPATVPAGGRNAAQGFSYAEAVRNTGILFDAARRAGIKRIVHISITNPSVDSPFEYFRGKALAEGALTGSGLGYAILRPAVLFGREGILINNIAWLLRKFPVFGVFGKGDYCLQSVYVDDLARLAVEHGGGRQNAVIDAIGPETYTYRELVRMIGTGIGRPRPVISIPPLAGYILGRLIGKMHGDVMITQDEIKGLMANLLCTDSPPSGSTRLSDWIKANGAALGRHYSSELARRQNRAKSYEEL
nr:hypothetical protein [Nitrospiraceae bacterium]